MALFFSPCHVSNLLIVLLLDVLSKQAFVMPIWINLLQVDLKTSVLNWLFQHQTNQEVVLLLQLLKGSNASWLAVFLAHTVIFAACLMGTPLNLSPPCHDVVMIYHSWTVSLLFQLCLAMVFLVHRVNL